jgi:aminoglycoside phosphotransferase (APT) family kinase protein
MLTREDITEALVSQLVTTQFPQWANLPIKLVEPSGWDNRTFHLGSAMTVRLPSAEGYAPQVEKEHRWLPKLAPLLPLPIPVPLAKGVPSEIYPWSWSIYPWLAGETATLERISDVPEFASSLAHFLTALQHIDATNGPPPGLDSGFRGGPLTTYDTETRNTLEVLGDNIDARAATAVWETALRAPWHPSPVWFHGDVAVGNLLVKEGKLSAVIDFGCVGVGDPACDLVIAWTLFSGESRQAFYAGLSVDDATWARGRGWALWKALITLAQHINTNPEEAAKARYVIDEVLADPIVMRR